MMALIPLSVDVPMRRWPLVNWALMALTVACFFAANQSWCLSRDDFAFGQLVSYQFVHADLLHLAGNMLFVWAFGNAINAKLGHVFYPLFYLLCGAISGLVWLLLGQEGYLLGASGAIMGVMGAFLVYYPKNDVRMGWWFIIRVGSFYLSAIILMVIYFVLDVLGVVLGSGGVAYIAHLGGWLIGFVMACGLVRSGLVGSDADEINFIQLVGLQPRNDR